MSPLIILGVLLERKRLNQMEELKDRVGKVRNVNECNRKEYEELNCITQNVGSNPISMLSP